MLTVKIYTYVYIIVYALLLCAKCGKKKKQNYNMLHYVGGGGVGECRGIRRVRDRLRGYPPLELSFIYISCAREFSSFFSLSCAAQSSIISTRMVFFFCQSLRHFVRHFVNVSVDFFDNPFPPSNLLLVNTLTLCLATLTQNKHSQRKIIQFV